MPRRATAVQDRFKAPEQLEAEADALLRGEELPGPGETLDSPDKLTPTDSPDKPAPGNKGKKDDTPADAAPSSQPSLGDTVQRLSEAQRRMHQAIQEAAEARGQNAQLTQNVNQLQAQLETLQAQIAELRANPAPGGTRAADSPVLDTVMTEIDALTENYPSIAKPLKDAITALQAQNNALMAQLAAVRSDVGKNDQALRATQESIEEKRIEDQFAPVLRAHHDAYELVADPQFQAWIRKRPTGDFLAIYGDPNRGGAGGDNETVIDIFDDYKQSIGKARSVRDAERDTTPNLRGGERGGGRPTNKPKGRMWTRAEIAALDFRKYSEKEWAEIEQDFTAAYAEGRVID